MDMRILTGTVRNGTIEVLGDPLPEGTEVTIVVHGPAATFELTPEEDAELFARIQEADRADIDAIVERVRFHMRGDKLPVRITAAAARDIEEALRSEADASGRPDVGEESLRGGNRTHQDS